MKAENMSMDLLLTVFFNFLKDSIQSSFCSTSYRNLRFGCLPIRIILICVMPDSYQKFAIRIKEFHNLRVPVLINRNKINGINGIDERELGKEYKINIISSTNI